MNVAEIDYGFGTATVWGAITEENAERFFMNLANQCFGIRKSVSRFRLVTLGPCEALPLPWSKMEGAATVLSHSGGDTIVWNSDGEKIKSEWD